MFEYLTAAYSSAKGAITGAIDGASAGWMESQTAEQLDARLVAVRKQVSELQKEESALVARIKALPQAKAQPTAAKA